MARKLLALLALLLLPAVALAQNQLPAIQGPGGYQTAAPTVIIGYDSGTSAPCVVGKTPTCSLATAGVGGTVTANQGTAGASPWPVTNSPNSTDGSAATFSAGTTVLGSWVAKASPGNLYGLNVTAGGTALFVMVFDAITPPADGAVTPKWCLPLAANAGLDKVFNPPLRGATGLTIVTSSTGCYTKTLSATAFISTQAK